MLDMKEIEEEIMKLEECNYTTYDVCKKLAILYTVRDHYNDQRTAAMPTTANTRMASPMMGMSNP